MNNAEKNLSPSATTGRIGIMHLKRYWEKSIARKTGKLAPDALQEEWNTDNTLLAALGLGLEQTIKQVFHSCENFEAFEQWVREVNGGKLVQEKIDAFNQSIINSSGQVAAIDPKEKILTIDDLNFWKENGYIIIKEAISKKDCADTVDLVCDHIHIKKDDPSTWYNVHPAKQGIMVQLFQDPLLEKNRQSKKIRSAYEQLWGRKDIWLNTDRVGFNPPETDTWTFPGPDLHWDVSLQLPVPFGLQGILYLTDTATNQGAFTLVPGFQNRVESWLNGLAPGINPREENIHALGAIPIAANAGDFIIWHQALPHGSSPNTSLVPRYVQYINYAPIDMEIREKWI
jgi:hypothetical protein